MIYFTVLVRIKYFLSTQITNLISCPDLDDPLADLDDLLPDETRLKSKSSVQQPKSKPKTVSPPSASPVLKGIYYRM